jgi:hypothetical protein
MPEVRNPNVAHPHRTYLSDRDMRTFECDGCGHSEMIAMKYSNAALSRSAWLKSLRDTRL